MTISRFLLIPGLLACIGALAVTASGEPAAPAPIAAAPSAQPAADVAPRREPVIPPRDYFPTSGWRLRSAAESGIDDAARRAFEDYVFPPPPSVIPGKKDQRLGIRTDGVVIIHRGYLVYERYARGYTADSRHYGWSMAKSVVNALIGIAEREGLLHRGSLVSEVDPRLTAPQLAGLTVDHLLHFSSGLKWAETYEYSPLKSSVIAMLYTAGSSDMARFVAAQPREFPPGMHYRYSSGDTTFLSSLLRAKLSQRDYDDFPFSRLFSPLGMTSAVFEQDKSGTFVGSSYVHATARDFAKFGFLYLNQGVWEGKQILPADWVSYSTQIAPAYAGTPPPDHDPTDVPGASLWLNAADGAAPRPWPDAPADAFAAEGHWGQTIVIIPSRDIVAVRLADDRDHRFSMNEYLRRLLVMLPSQSAEVRP
jgi:CubicO group peptidase (beta-lactamase class C family)